MGHQTEVVYDGEAAVSAAQNFKPDLVLLDIGMPKKNGYEAAREIRKHPGGAAIKLVALTGWGEDGAREKSTAAGFDQHLVKPVDHAELLKLLAEM